MGDFRWKAARIGRQISRDERQDAVVLGKVKEKRPVESGVGGLRDAGGLLGGWIGGGACAKEIEAVLLVQQRANGRGEHSFNHRCEL